MGPSVDIKCATWFFLRGAVGANRKGSRKTSNVIFQVSYTRTHQLSNQSIHPKYRLMGNPPYMVPTTFREVKGKLRQKSRYSGNLKTSAEDNKYRSKRKLVQTTLHSTQCTEEGLASNSQAPDIGVHIKNSRSCSRELSRQHADFNETLHAGQKKRQPGI